MKEEITEHDVYIYRELYYETAKPLIRAGASSSFIEEMLIPRCEHFGWTLDKYRDFSSLDLMQRIASLSIKTASEDRVFVKTTKGEKLNYHGSLDLPELKCPIRTEQKD